MSSDFRIEKDSLGEKKVPREAYYGIQTARAIENFPISGLRPHQALVEATVLIKLAAAKANMFVADLDNNKGEAIIKAAWEVMEGKFQDQFVVDPFQAGAGTSHNMNANEVLANRAIEILGGEKGNYGLVHPNDHVNMGQSTNDVFPTAMRLSTLVLLKKFYPVAEELIKTFRQKGLEFDSILKSGRTHLQDAVPIRLGQEFEAYAKALSDDLERIGQSSENLKILGIGGNAVGTGLNTKPGFRKKLVQELASLTGMELKSSVNLIEATQNLNPLAAVSSSLKLFALSLIRIANDVRLLSSGPKTGLGEIILPAVQPGSSMMPGKVNPVMAEVLDMVAFQVVGNDLTVAMATQAGQFELNVMMPVIIHNILQSLDILTHVCEAFTQKCLSGIQADPERCWKYVEESMGIATALNPYLGYEVAAKLVQESLATKIPVKQLVLSKGLLSPQMVEQVFSLEKMTEAP
ncbi:MAG: aspartate ammonia-lyase [Candidatus Tectomicrobia bacterium]|uniref:Aspartate ammonia-lyase n=1 Tax=Tectimicrobiota bacterium TaxID=2528274 RepID=A0A933GLM3_UNCTE|nr:aspartate ammonia-lyase [Candidatus Tectomicrobia bacterium]